MQKLYSLLFYFILLIKHLTHRLDTSLHFGTLGKVIRVPSYVGLYCCMFVKFRIQPHLLTKRSTERTETVHSTYHLHPIRYISHMRV